MLRTGIYQVEQLQNASELDCYGLARPISISLYDQVHQLDAAEQLGERILFQFSNARATFKRTHSRRFDDFDKAVSQLLQSAFPTAESLRVHDLGISDGRTACDFFEHLLPLYPELEYWASDYEAAVQVFEHGSKKLAFGDEGQPLEMVVPPFVFNLVHPPSWKRYPLHRLARWYYSTTTLPQLQQLAKDQPENIRLVPLFSQRTLKCAAAHPNFHLLTYNVLKPFEASQNLHAVRAMNVLNLDYFKPAERLVALSTIHTSLQIGGYFISGSNQNASTEVDGGVYQKTVQGYDLIQTFGSGHHWQKEILAWRAE